jgi:hypothetical protein
MAYPCYKIYKTLILIMGENTYIILCEGKMKILKSEEVKDVPSENTVNWDIDYFKLKSLKKL